VHGTMIAGVDDRASRESLLAIHDAGGLVVYP
jgi:hypothetical protein